MDFPQKVASLFEELPVEDAGQDEGQQGAAAGAHQSHHGGEVRDQEDYHTRQ